MNLTLLDHFKDFLVDTFELIVFIRYFLNTYILHIFMRRNSLIFLTVLSGGGLFHAVMERSQCCECFIDRKISIVLKNGLLF